MKYQMTHLEEDIRDLYLSFGVTDPSLIDMYSLSYDLDIWIHDIDDESTLIKLNGNYTIFLNENLSPQERWQDFGHEIGHALKHEGNQDKLKKSFRTLQEFQANNFMYHFCVPTFMLLNYEITNFTDINIGTAFIMEKFNVTESFSKKRLEQFRNKLFQAKSDEEFRNRKEPVYNYSKGIPPRKLPSHTNEIVSRALAFKRKQVGVFN
jgi:Zn-dependent peptidase ImmA (M78 family)